MSVHGSTESLNRVRDVGDVNRDENAQDDSVCSPFRGFQENSSDSNLSNYLEQIMLKLNEHSSKFDEQSKKFDEQKEQSSKLESKFDEQGNKLSKEIRSTADELKSEIKGSKVELDVVKVETDTVVTAVSEEITSKCTVKVEDEVLTNFVNKCRGESKVVVNESNANHSDELVVSEVLENVQLEKKERQSSFNVIVVEAKFHAHDDDSLGGDICSGSFTQNFVENDVYGVDDDDVVFKSSDRIVHVDMGDVEVLQDSNHLKSNVSVHDKLQIPIDVAEIKPYPENASELGELVCEKIFNVTCDYANGHELEVSVESNCKKVCQNLHPEWGVTGTSENCQQQIEAEEFYNDQVDMGFREEKQDLIFKNENCSKGEVNDSSYVISQTENFKDNCLVDNGDNICGIPKLIDEVEVKCEENYVDFPVNEVKFNTVTSEIHKQTDREFLLKDENCVSQGKINSETSKSSELTVKQVLLCDEESFVKYPFTEVKFNTASSEMNEQADRKLLLGDENCVTEGRINIETSNNNELVAKQVFLSEEENVIKSPMTDVKFYITTSNVDEITDIKVVLNDIVYKNPRRMSSYQSKSVFRTHDRMSIKPSSTPMCKRAELERRLQMMQTCGVVKLDTLRGM